MNHAASLLTHFSLAPWAAQVNEQQEDIRSALELITGGGSAAAGALVDGGITSQGALMGGRAFDARRWGPSFEGAEAYGSGLPGDGVMSSTAAPPAPADDDGAWTISAGGNGDNGGSMYSAAAGEQLDSIQADLSALEAAIQQAMHDIKL
jgi:hypothetical protein